MKVSDHKNFWFNSSSVDAVFFYPGMFLHMYMYALNMSGYNQPGCICWCQVVIYLHVVRFTWKFIFFKVWRSCVDRQVHVASVNSTMTDLSVWISLEGRHPPMWVMNLIKFRIHPPTTTESRPILILIGLWSLGRFDLIHEIKGNLFTISLLPLTKIALIQW